VSTSRAAFGRGALLALVALALVLLWHLPRSAEHVFNWDSVNYALGAQHYDLKLHQPHPPGYPLWILALRGLTRLGVDANLAQILLAQASVALALLALLDLARPRGRGAQALVGGLLLASPLVALHARIAGTYTAELMASTLVGWACADLWHGRTRRAPVALLAWVAAAGLRTSAAVFTGPLLVVALWRGFGGRRGRALLAMLTAGVGALACYVPVWLSLGPLPASFFYWRHMLDTLFSGPLDASSWFRGAPAAAHVGMLVRVGSWWTYGLLPALPALWLLRARRRPAHDADPPADAHAADDRAARECSVAFLALWAAPAVGFLTLLYAPHPGYVLAPLPPLLLLLARAVPRTRPSPARLAGALGALLLVAELLALPRFGPRLPPGQAPRGVGASLALATPAQIADSDAQLDALAAALATRPPHEPLLVTEIDWNQANWRKLAWTLPERPVWLLDAGRGALAWMHTRQRHESEPLTVAAEAETLWLVAQSEEPPDVLVRAFPDARRVLRAGAVSLWRAELGVELPIVLEHGPRRWALKRE